MTVTIQQAAEALGIELLPWQKEVADRFEAGERFVFVQGGKKAGRATLRRVLDEWERANRPAACCSPPAGTDACLDCPPLPRDERKASA